MEEWKKNQEEEKRQMEEWKKNQEEEKRAHLEEMKLMHAIIAEMRQRLSAQRQDPYEGIEISSAVVAVAAIGATAAYFYLTKKPKVVTLHMELNSIYLDVGEAKNSASMRSKSESREVRVSQMMGSFLT